nr:nero [Cucujiformia]
YCLGQMQDENANSILVSVLEDKSQEPMVRHEAAEALGAIGSLRNISVLEKYKEDPVIEVAETCELALDRIKWSQQPNDTKRTSENPYKSVDPAPPHESIIVEDLKAILLDEKMPLFQRYRAMFALRNLGTEEALEALGQGLKCGSALFKHEIAFVLGQIQSERSVQVLKESLEDSLENE